jgi:hypothetical protein
MMTIERGSPTERRLLKLLRALSAQDRATLLAFAEFLGSRAGSDQALESPLQQTPVARPRPQPEPRPAQESVVAAIKRLRRGYPMLEPGEMLHETSALMASHVLQGREAEAVIDELEALFARRYQALDPTDEDQPGAPQDD